MHKYILFIVLIMLGLTSMAQKEAFEGAISFVKRTHTDTVKYTYYIKNRMVRFDEHSEGNKKNYLLFDLDKETIVAISVDRKLYIDIPTKPFVKMDEDEFEIIKSPNNKEIHGYKCYQWRVKNRSQNTEIAYWVVNDNFMFFEEFLMLWNRTEKHAKYYLMIPGVDGYFPMHSVERTLLRDLKMKLEVEKIERKKLEDSMFEIPAGFKSYYE